MIVSRKFSLQFQSGCTTHQKSLNLFQINHTKRCSSKFVNIIRKQSAFEEENIRKPFDEDLFSPDYTKNEEIKQIEKQKKDFYEEGEKAVQFCLQCMNDLKNSDLTRGEQETVFDSLIDKSISKGDFIPPDKFTQIIGIAYEKWGSDLSNSNYKWLLQKWIDRIQKQVNFLTTDEILDAIIMSCKVRREFWKVTLDFMMEQLGSKIGEADKKKLSLMLQEITQMGGRTQKSVPQLIRAIFEFLQQGGDMSAEDFIVFSDSISLVQKDLENNKWKIIDKKAFQHIEEMSTDQIIQILAAFARSNYRSSLFFSQISEFVEQKENQLLLNQTIELIWVLGRLKYKKQIKLFEKLQLFIQQQAENLKPHELLVVTWSLTQMEKFDEKFLDILAQKFVQDINIFSDKQIAQAAYCFGFFEYDNYGVFREISNQILIREDLNLDPESVQYLLFGFAQSQFYNQKTIQILLNVVVQQKLDVYGTSALISIVNLLAQLRHYDNIFLEIIQEDTIDKFGSVTAEQFSGLMHAYTNLWFEPEFSMVMDMKKKIHNEIQRINLEIVVDLVWSLNAFQYLESDLVQIFSNRLKKAKVSQFTSIDLRRLYHYHLLFKYSLKNLDEDEDAIFSSLKESVQKVCEENYKKRVKESRIISGFQKNVFEIIQSFKIDCEMEACVNDGEIFIDIEIVQGRKKFAVEVDGDSHFSRSEPYWELGSTKLRNRILQGMDYTVIQIPFYDWIDKVSMIQKREYILNILQEYGVKVKSPKIDTGYTYDNIKRVVKTA